MCCANSCGLSWILQVDCLLLTAILLVKESLSGSLSSSLLTTPRRVKLPLVCHLLLVFHVIYVIYHLLLVFHVIIVVCHLLPCLLCHLLNIIHLTASALSYRQRNLSTAHVGTATLTTNSLSVLILTINSHLLTIVYLTSS